MTVTNYCPACQTETTQSFTGSQGEYSDCGIMVNEYLYRCHRCGENIWVGEQNLKNEVSET